MLVWQLFRFVIADECSSGGVSLLLLLMGAPLAVFRCFYSRLVLVWRRFGVVIADECSSGGVSVLLLLMGARLAACQCSYY